LTPDSETSRFRSRGAIDPCRDGGPIDGCGFRAAALALDFRRTPRLVSDLRRAFGFPTGFIQTPDSIHEMRFPRAAVPFVLAAMTLGLTCAAPPQERSQVATPEPPRPPASVRLPPAPASAEPAPASAEPAPTSTVTPTAESPPALAPREGAPGSTRGTVSCGSQRCDASKEVCAIVAGPSWACVPKLQKDDTPSYFECDDGTDCPPGKTCCLSGATSGTYFVCGARRECLLEACGEGGARCPAGQRCQNGWCSPSGRTGATCAKGVVCGGDTPVCHASPTQNTCISLQEAEKLGEVLARLGTDVVEDRNFALLRCTQNADCGAGFHCCASSRTGTHESSCSLNCYIATQFCATDADCPKVPEASRPSCRRSDPYLPPWSKLCQYD